MESGECLKTNKLPPWDKEELEAKKGKCRRAKCKNKIKAGEYFCSDECKRIYWGKTRELGECKFRTVGECQARIKEIIKELGSKKSTRKVLNEEDELYHQAEQIFGQGLLI